MEKTLEHVAAEIDKLREDLHQLYLSNNHVTPEVLLLSGVLDEKINEYLRLQNVSARGGESSKQN